MWFADRSFVQAGLLEHRIVVARQAGTRAGASDRVETLDVDPLPAGFAPWQPGVDALAQWLQRQPSRPARLRVVVSGHFVRWQLVPWQPELTRPDEVEAYVRLRLRAAFGAQVDAWRVVHTEPQPGGALLACAIDDALAGAIEALQPATGVRVVGVVPYFAAAFDHWRRRLGRRDVWFAVVEPTHLTLALRCGGDWCGLRAVRHTGGEVAWRGAIEPLQAQMAAAGGVSSASKLPLFVAGCVDGAAALPNGDGTWLAPDGAEEAAHGLARIAWGV